MRFKSLIMAAIVGCCLMGSTSCRLVFEPDVDAVNRLMRSMPTGEHRVVEEMCDGEQVCNHLNQLASLISSNWYASSKDFFTFDHVEIAEDTNYSYVYIKLRIPASGSQREQMLPLVFEMERIKLRWHIYRVDGLAEFLRRATRARGIL